jgi:hypothetical protein
VWVAVALGVRVRVVVGVAVDVLGGTCVDVRVRVAVGVFVAAGRGGASSFPPQADSMSRLLLTSKAANKLGAFI